MSVDLTDPSIAQAYDNIVKLRDTTWLLLNYGQSRDRLALFATGRGGIDELRERLPGNDDEVFFGFCRDEDEGKNYFTLVAYVPTNVSGVRRARAVVHFRAVGTVFKAHNVVLNTADRDSINLQRIKEQYNLGPSYIPRLASNNLITQRTVSEPNDPRSSSDTTTSSGDAHSPRIMKFASDSNALPAPPAFRHQAGNLTVELDDDIPPPTPPKDKTFSNGSVAGRSSLESRMKANQAHAMEMGRRYPPVSRGQDYRSNSSDSDSPGPHSNGRGSFDAFRSQVAQRVLSPEEKAQRRLEAQRLREREEAKAAREEEERQAILKRQKEILLKQADEDDRRRRAIIEEEKRRALAERAKREKERMAEEERKAEELEIRKRLAREKRAEQARRLQEEQEENVRRMEELTRRKEEERRHAELTRQQKMREIQKQYEGLSGSTVLLSGIITVQTSSSVVWKRRYFELSNTALNFHRDSQERGVTPLDALNLSERRVTAIKEPSEGYDELEAIPHSFAVELSDDSPWCLYADSEEEKDIFMSLLAQAAGL